MPDPKVPPTAPIVIIYEGAGEIKPVTPGVQVRKKND